MINYRFIACNEKLPTFQEALEDEKMKSYNELLKMGLTEEQIKIRGIDLSKVDRDKKVFLIFLPEELKTSPLVIKNDSSNTYARYLTDKKYIYRVEGVENSLIHFAGYIGKYADIWTELELWQVLEDDYLVDPLSISQTIIKSRQMTIEKLEEFLETDIPKKLILVQR